MEVKGETYRVVYNDTTSTVLFEGMLRLPGSAEYGPIGDLLNSVVGAAPEVMTLDLCSLRFLNSAGIDLLLRFALKMRKQATTQVIILGAANIPWQGRSLPHFERLVPGLELTLE